MVCIKCDTELGDNQEFCHKCGSRVESDKVFCSKCGAKLTLQQEFCHKCGTPVSGKKKQCFRCGSDIEDGQAFCPKCGQSMLQSNSYTAPIMPQNISQESIYSSTAKARKKQEKLARKAERAKKDRPGKGLTIFSVVLAVFLKFLLMAFINILAIKIGLSDSSVRTMVKKTDIKKFDVSLFVGHDSSYYLDEYLSDFFLHGATMSDSGMSDEDRIDVVDGILGKESLKDYAIDSINNIKNYMAWGQEDYSLVRSDLLNVISTDYPVINRVMGNGITEADVRSFNEELTKVKDDYGINLKPIFTWMWAMSLLFIVVIFIIWLKKWNKSFKVVGIPMIVSSLICLIERFVVADIIGKQYSAIKPFTSSTFMVLMITSIVFFVVGVIMTSSAIICDIKNK